MGVVRDASCGRVVAGNLDVRYGDREQPAHVCRPARLVAAVADTRSLPIR
jgi:hypothetical protein